MTRTDLTRLSVRLDRHLNQFALAANAQGEYPWQQQQREQRNKRLAGAAVGTAGVAAGGYGVKKGVDALKNRYGVASGMDALKVGAYDGAQKVGDYAKQGYGIAKEKVGALAGRTGAYGGKILKAGQQGWKQGGIKGAGRLVMNALRKVRFSSSRSALVQLESVLDGALTELAEREREGLRKVAGLLK